MQLHFILGIGRSGTSILTKLLNSYKDVHCMPEANFILFFLQKFGSKKSFSSKEIHQIFIEIELYSYSHPWVGWDFGIKEAKENILCKLNQKKQITFEELSILIYSQFKVKNLDKSSSNIIIDKNPSYTIFAEKISKYFPNAKFIWIIRDYRANILSRKQSVFLKSPNIAFNAIRWKIYNKAAYKFYKKNPEKVILVKYEDLVQNATSLNKILDFLQIDNTKKEIEKTQELDLENFKIEDRFKERFYKKYSDLNKVINTNRIQSWKEQLSLEEIKICDIICKNAAKKTNYLPITNLSILNKTSIYLFNFIPIYKAYLDIFKVKIIYYFPINFKLKRLKKKYIELGIIK